MSLQVVTPICTKQSSTHLHVYVLCINKHAHTQTHKISSTMLLSNPVSLAISSWRSLIVPCLGNLSLYWAMEIKDKRVRVNRWLSNIYWHTMHYTDPIIRTYVYVITKSCYNWNGPKLLLYVVSCRLNSDIYIDPAPSWCSKVWVKLCFCIQPSHHIVLTSWLSQTSFQITSSWG